LRAVGGAIDKKCDGRHSAPAQALCLTDIGDLACRQDESAVLAFENPRADKGSD
jgi:hypothetical protein